mgnify:CR=1 FL=1
MTIFDYIKKYGNYSFKEKKLNEVDNIIFSCLSYVPLNDIVSSDFSNKITIEEAGKLYFEKNGKKIDKKQMISIKQSILVFKKIMNVKRYKDILMHNYQYVSSDKLQFGALSLDIDEHTVYVSFEGTDHLISGWIEDYMISCLFPVDAQKLSIKYLNRYLFNNKKLIVGGHSKGGHLSIISSMYCNYFIKRRIIKIYSNDGLGLRQQEFESRKYRIIKNRITKLVPEHSIVGYLLNSDSNIKIVKSSKKSFNSHNPSTWIIKDNKFERSKYSKFCSILSKALNRWLLQYDTDTKIKFTELISNICKKHNIETLYDLKGKKRLLLKDVLDSKNTDIKVKEMFKELYIIFRECNKEYKEEMVK